MHFDWPVSALARRAPLQPWPACQQRWCGQRGAAPCSASGQQLQRGRGGRAGTTAAACDFDESPRDAYGGITVVIVRETDDFEAALTASLDRWRRDGVRGVWLEVPAALVKYLPAILDRGFTLRGGDATHVLCCAWLPGGESPLPPGPTHQVGVGAVVTDRAGRLLLVQEAVGPAQGRWKLPTGALQRGERRVGRRRAREVREETGLEVRPAEVLAVRHSHGFHRGVSDVFFCVRCEVIDEGAVLTPQAGEIARVEWRPVSDAHDAATPAWRRIYQIASTGRGGLRVDTYPGRAARANDPYLPGGSAMGSCCLTSTSRRSGGTTNYLIFTRSTAVFNEREAKARFDCRV